MTKLATKPKPWTFEAQGSTSVIWMSDGTPFEVPPEVAPLITAAPDMLAMLKRIDSPLSKGYTARGDATRPEGFTRSEGFYTFAFNSPMGIALRALIAKAEGR